MMKDNVKFDVGDSVRHKASGEIAQVEYIKSKFCTGRGGHAVATGWIDVSYGFNKTATVRHESLEKIEKE